MSSQLIVSVSGIRGIIGDSLTPETALPYVRAFAASLEGKKVVLGGDSRPSRAWLVPLVQAALVASGKEVHNIGICPTPTVGIMIRKLKAAGGIAITASHNPIVYNGLKFFHDGGEFFTAQHNARVKKILEKGQWLNPGVEGTGRVVEEPGAIRWHIELVLRELGRLALKGARAAGASSEAPRRFRVVVDCCNAAGSVIAPGLLEQLGCEVIPIYCDPTKPFPHEAEPLPENLTALCRAVKKHKADLGFALDPDADRLGVIDETGKPIGEERTLVLAADAFYTLATGAKKKAPYVVNLSCSMANDDVARKHGVEIFRTPIGEANVVEGIHKYGAFMGGEGNGGVIYPAVQNGRDAATAMAWMLIALRLSGMTMSQLNRTIPNYVMMREKVPLRAMSVEQALKAAEKEFAGAQSVDRRDGLKFLWADSWFHIRPSNTEPIIRVTAEAPTEAAARALLQRANRALKKK